MAENHSESVRVKAVSLLSDNWYILKKYTFDLLRRDGSWQEQVREVYDRGNGAAILLYNRSSRRVVLVRQFRMPAFVNGHPEPLIEVCAGLLDGRDPESCIARETEEETGYRIARPRRVFEAFMSPGSVTERITCFVAEYDPAARVSDGGGHAHEGEDIEVLEPTLDEALAMVESGTIADAKTIMLLQYARLNGLVGDAAQPAGDG